MFAYNNRMEIALGVAVGSATQVCVCVCVCEVGWVERGNGFKGCNTGAQVRVCVCVCAPVRVIILCVFAFPSLIQTGGSAGVALSHTLPHG